MTPESAGSARESSSRRRSPAAPSAVSRRSPSSVAAAQYRRPRSGSTASVVRLCRSLASGVVYSPARLAAKSVAPAQ